MYLEAVLSYLNNWFCLSKHTGEYTIDGGKLDLPFLLSGQYFRIKGSALNDGLYIYGGTITDEDRVDVRLKDETFTGTIYAIGSIPKDVLQTADDIQKWNEKYGEIAASPYSSESFAGVYSYSKAGTGSSGGGWQSVFGSRLEQYRKLPGSY